MSNIIPFSFDNHQLRTAEGVGDSILFVASDVAEILGYSETSKLLAHCKHSTVLGELNKINKLPSATKWIPESDLYRATMRSNMPSADRFQDWVCEEVLPTIRKTGSYVGSAPRDSLDAKVRVQIGGIVKGIVAKAVNDAMRVSLPALIHGALAAHQTMMRKGETAGQVWKRWNLQTKGMRGYPTWFGNRLAAKGCQIDDGGRAEVGGITSRLFDPDKCDSFKKGDPINPGLLEECLKYVAHRLGQGRFDFDSEPV